MAFALSEENQAFLRAFAQTRAFLLGRPARPAVTPDGEAVLFLRSEARSSRHDLFELDLASGETRRLCTSQQLQGTAAEAELSAEEKARRERQRITDTGITQFSLAPRGPGVLVPLAGALFVFDRTKGSSWRLLPNDHPPVMDARFLPDGGAVAFVSEHDLWVLPLSPAGEAAGAPVRLTPGGTATRFFGAPEFVAQEEMGRFEGYWFSPSGGLALVTVVDEAPVETFTIPDPAHPEKPPASFRYPRPGRANADVGLIVVSRTGQGAPVEVSWDKRTYPYLARVSWHAAGKPPIALVQSRDQRRAALLSIDTETGVTKPLFVEEDPDWVNLEPGLPRWLPDGSGILCVSEAGGAPALQLRDPQGCLLGDVVPPSAGFLALVSVEMPARTLVVLLGEALHSRLARVPVDPTDGEAPQWLTGDDEADEGDRSGVVAGGVGERLIIVENRVSARSFPVWRVLNREGQPLHRLPDVAQSPPFDLNLEFRSVGAQRWNTVVVRPVGFDPDRRYPVIVHVYGGPHAQMVKVDPRHYVFDQWLANQGAIVVAIDNRGTPRRGRRWERAIKGAFADVPLADQVEALQALGAEVPQLDLRRVGIYGWSYGGFMSALAVLRRPDVFQVAVAGAPVVDWLDYDTHYTERYLGLPDAAPEAYQRANLLTYAAGLERPLLLVHGTADDNVYLLHSLKLADALLRHGRVFDFLPLPGTTHQIGDAVVRERLWGRVAHYLFQHLEALPA